MVFVRKAVLVRPVLIIATVSRTIWIAVVSLITKSVPVLVLITGALWKRNMNVADEGIQSCFVVVTGHVASHATTQYASQRRSGIIVYV